MATLKYIEIASHYELAIALHEFQSWHEKLVNGEELPAEILGLLIGRARICFRPEPCSICHKKMIVGSDHKSAKGVDGVNDRYYLSGMAHEKCYKAHLLKLEREMKRRQGQSK